MNVQYISDSTGLTTGVFIPIKDWNAIKDKYVGIEDDTNVPPWHKEIVQQRMENYHNNPDQALDFDATVDDIDKML